MARKDITYGVIIWVFCMDSSWSKTWKDFNLGWWNALESVRFPGICRFENLTLWIQLRIGLCNHAWKDITGNSRKLPQLFMTIFSKFWLRDRCPICIHGSRACCSTCIAEHVTSEVVDIPDTVFSLILSFRDTSVCGNGQICPFTF